MISIYFIFAKINSCNNFDLTSSFRLMTSDDRELRLYVYLSHAGFLKPFDLCPEKMKVVPDRSLSEN